MTPRLSTALLCALFVGTLTAADRPTVVVDGKSYPVYQEQEAPPVKRVSPSLMGTGPGGEVTVGAVVDEKGKVRKIYIVDATAGGEVRAAIVNAVKASKFPVMRDPATQAAISYVVVIKSAIYKDPPRAPAVSPKFAEIIFDPKFFRATLGIKALVAADPKTGEIAPGLREDLNAAGLTDAIQLIPLPKDAVLPTPTSRVAPYFPDELRRKNVGGAVRFIFVIGADGSVKGVYCAATKSRELAAAFAAALVRWRFEPARIQNTPVPIVTSQVFEFSTE